MSQTGPPSETGGDRPPRRMLERPPSERLAASSAVAGAQAVAGSTARAITYGLAAATAGALVHVVAATLLLWTGALLVVAVTIGILVGLGVALGGGSALRPSSRRSLAVVIAVTSIVVAVGVSWALSGMFLGPLDYALEVYGLLVPAQFVLAAFGALAGSR